MKLTVSNFHFVYFFKYLWKENWNLTCNYFLITCQNLLTTNDIVAMSLRGSISRDTGTIEFNGKWNFVLKLRWRKLSLFCSESRDLTMGNFRSFCGGYSCLGLGLKNGARWLGFADVGILRVKRRTDTGSPSAMAMASRSAWLLNNSALWVPLQFCKLLSVLLFVSMIFLGVSRKRNQQYGSPIFSEV